MKILCKYNILLVTAIAIAVCGTSCSETDMSNKAERNAIKRGNERFKEKKYPEAATEYDNALKANAASEAAVYNKAMANLYDQKSDSAALTQARKNLNRLASNGTDAAISERALYNLGNDAVYIGDAIKAAAEQEQSSEAKQQMTQESTKHYKQAIENYKEILRRRPNNITALQNLRIAQLKL
ncbi:MAG: hypothetical protein Q4F07_02385, partial [Bacteroidales bacterium]|nr:hypothetical protein [Bacteroidales bacterium]